MFEEKSPKGCLCAKEGVLCEHHLRMDLLDIGGVGRIADEVAGEPLCQED